MSTAKRKGVSRLGRGLDALLSTAIPAAPTDTAQESPKVITSDNEFQKIAITSLVPGKYQPRRDMSDTALE